MRTADTIRVWTDVAALGALGGAPSCVIAVDQEKAEGLGFAVDRRLWAVGEGDRAAIIEVVPAAD